jgi:adenine deaminase
VTLVVEGDRIARVLPGPGRDVPAPAGGHVPDATGLTVLPGLIDAHVHDATAPWAAALFLRFGVPAVSGLHRMVLRCRSGTPPRLYR